MFLPFFNKYNIFEKLCRFSLTTAIGVSEWKGFTSEQRNDYMRTSKEHRYEK